ncbi:MAG: TlpA disulfide reductase family protein [Bacteroidota bacterium]
MYKFVAATVFAAFFGLLLTGCLSADHSYTRVAPGLWRGVLSLEHFQIPVHKKDTVILLTDQFKDGELPFQFNVTYIDNERFYVEFINGSERIRCDSIRYGRDRMQARDTMNMYFPEYQSYIHAEIRGGVMQGEWVVTTKDNYRIPFYAHAGRGYRFTPLNEKPISDITGNWAALFGVEKQDAKPEKAIAELKQNGNHLEGTFRTESGDYRYLEGTVQGRKFWMSCFDGAHAFLFSGKISNDTLQGEFRSGKHSQTLWTAWKDPNFKLGNPDSLTTLKTAGAFTFDVKTPEGQDLKFPSPAYDGKVKIFTISGTWCPNCKDEQLFLRDFLKTHPEMANQIAVTAFSFERNKDIAQANAQLVNYRKVLNLPYPVVYAGKAGTAEATAFFPMLSNVSAFPTMIIVDKKNKVRRIHTGFDGPATSKFEDFQKDFSAFLTALTAE